MSRFNMIYLLFLLLGISLALVDGDSEFEVPSTINADTDVTIHLDNGVLVSHSDSYGDFERYRVFLSYNDPSYDSVSLTCALAKINFTATETSGTDFTVRIPSLVGPPGSTYSMYIEEFNDTIDGGCTYGTYTPGSSNEFTLSGATGKWSQAEMEGLSLNDTSQTCAALDCARNCNQAFYPANKDGSDSVDQAAYKSTYECTAACPGNDFMTWDEQAAWFKQFLLCNNTIVWNGTSYYTGTPVILATTDVDQSSFISRTFGSSYPTDSITHDRPSATTTDGVTKVTDSASHGTTGGSTSASSTSTSASISTTSSSPTPSPTPSTSPKPSLSSANNISFNTTPSVVVMLWGLCLAVNSMF